MIDLLFCAKGRPEFTAASAETLMANTPEHLFRRIYVYPETDDPDECVKSIPAVLSESSWAACRNFGSPVACMLDMIRTGTVGDFEDTPEIFAKIDNDVIVPPGWLEKCLAVMEAHPELDLLGIEPWQSRTANPQTGKRGDEPENTGPYVRAKDKDGYWSMWGYARTKSIGGIGLFRRRAFDRFPDLRAEGTYGGFTSWQLRHPELVIGWVVPPLKLFLLDRLPMDPWKALSLRYIREGQQRPWTDYSPEVAQELAGWWLDGR